MITNKYINKTIIGLLIAAIIFAGMMTFLAGALNIESEGLQQEYTTKLFDENKIISIDIKADESEWENMLENATQEEYIPCDVTINGTTFESVGIRPKGNSSLSMVAGSDSDRFSFKFEFDHYIDGQTCFGLDKLVINNIQADATYMKEYLSYDLMSYMGVTTPLYSYTNVTVNGKDWGFYLAVEALEESFAQRNYGESYGKLYKPESMGMRGNGNENGLGDERAAPWNNGEGNIGKQKEETQADKTNKSENEDKNIDAGKINDETTQNNNKTNSMKAGTKTGETGEAVNKAESQGTVGEKTGDTENTEGSGNFERGGGFDKGGFLGGGFGGGPGGGSGGGADLKYSDDSISSYSNIFDYEVFEGGDADYNKVIEALKNLNAGTELEKYINVDATLRYFAANTVLVNLDSYFGSLKHNYYLYEKDGQLTMLPWDYNLSFGGFQSESATSAVNFPIDTPVSGVDMSERPILAKLLEVDEYKEKYHQYLQDIVDGYFNSGTFENTITELDGLISEYVKNDATAFYSYDKYTAAVEVIKEFGKLRAQSIQGQLDGTIPSTTDGQASESGKLIDAAAINLSTMGSQGGGGMGRQGGMQPPGGSEQSDNGNMQQPDSGNIQPPGGSEQLDNGNMQQPDGTQQPDSGNMQPPDGAEQSGNGDMPDRETAMKAMQIIQAANDGDLTEEQITQLKELGLTDTQISSMKDMFSQGNMQQRGERGGRPGDMKNQESTASSESIYLIAASAVCLLAGLLFVIKFKRVKY
ncbi:CotH protein [Ruminiclostridium sufflavum DSM 19573]|uniref:CotH protein n=1 Tax=Ruminiclostridium sufflavum DSM 19573 TaxID=1121337 RepID=A0A318XQE2_9FIRM|nr:CotH kinase family protein [Ruminiclostridium sufflavum]PYG89550.1 CotH protein [Ruminiclostridium sufflavum DSM 19573]